MNIKEIDGVAAARAHLLRDDIAHAKGRLTAIMLLQSKLRLRDNIDKDWLEKYLTWMEVEARNSIQEAESLASPNFVAGATSRGSA